MQYLKCQWTSKNIPTCSNDAYRILAAQLNQNAASTKSLTTNEILKKYSWYVKGITLFSSEVKLVAVSICTKFLWYPRRAARPLKNVPVIGTAKKKKDCHFGSTSGQNVMTSVFLSLSEFSIKYVCLCFLRSAMIFVDGILLILGGGLCSLQQCRIL